MSFSGVTVLPSPGSLCSTFMKRLLILLALLSLHSASGQLPPELGKPVVPTIKDSYDLRRYLAGTTWTWCWKSDGSNGSEITFTADGKVKHNAFNAKYTVRSLTDVDLQWNGQVAKLHFDRTNYVRFTGEDFGKARTLYGTIRPAGSTASVEELTIAAFSAAPKPTPTPAPAVASSTPKPSPTPAAPSTAGRTTYFGNTNAGGAPKTSVADPAIERDLDALSAKYTEAVAPLNKRLQADLAPLLKRAEQAGDTVTAAKIKKLAASLDAVLKDDAQ